MDKQKLFMFTNVIFPIQWYSFLMKKNNLLESITVIFLAKDVHDEML